MRGEDFFIPNIDAMIARLALQTGASSAWERWYRDKAPKELQRPCTIDRYVYMTLAETEVARDCPGQALRCLPCGDVSSSAASMQSTSSCSTRSQPLPFSRIEEESGTYENPDGEGGSWRELFVWALASASRFSFVQPIATFGIAVLPLLQESEWNEDPKFLARTIAFARQQSTFYPKFMQPPVKHERPLTPTERRCSASFRRPLECRYRRDPGNQASDRESPCLPYHAEARRDDTCQGEGGCTEAGACLGADAPPACRICARFRIFRLCWS